MFGGIEELLSEKKNETKQTRSKAELKERDDNIESVIKEPYRSIEKIKKHSR